MNMDIGYIFEHSPPFAKGIWFTRPASTPRRRSSRGSERSPTSNKHLR